MQYLSIILIIGFLSVTLSSAKHHHQHQQGRVTPQLPNEAGGEPIVILHKGHKGRGAIVPELPNESGGVPPVVVTRNKAPTIQVIKASKSG